MTLALQVNINRDGYMAADDDSDLDMSAPPLSVTNSSPSVGRGEEEAPRGAASVDVSAPALFGVKEELYRVYQYDTGLRIDLPPLDNSADEPDYFAGIKKWEDEKEVCVQPVCPMLPHVGLLGA